MAKFKISKRLNFLNSNIKLEFTQLMQVFTNILIFYYFNLKYYIIMKIYISKYIIYNILSKLFSDYLTLISNLSFAKSDLS